MKGYNFRFSDREIADLDSLVVEMNKERTLSSFWGNATRTGVLKKLIKDKLGEIDTAARKAAGLAEVNGKPQKAKGKVSACKTKKQPCKKMKERLVTSSPSPKSAKRTTR